MAFIRFRNWFTGIALASGLVLGAPGSVLAHCDGLDGPVVTAARRALDAQDPAPVLIWVRPADESEIRAAFQQTLTVRALGTQAKELADRFFFETVVRVHRAGEGAPYTGLHPAGRDLGPAIPAADKALEDGSVEPLAQLLARAAREGLRERFEQAMAARAFEPGQVASGREYVRRYVEFIHYVERLYEASTTPAHGHFGEGEHTGDEHTAAPSQ